MLSVLGVPKACTGVTSPWTGQRESPVGDSCTGIPQRGQLADIVTPTTVPFLTPAVNPGLGGLHRYRHGRAPGP